MTTPRLATALILLLLLVATAGTASAMEGQAWGDIHVRTMDGATYDFQAAGEFIASHSPAGDFEVQLRLESAGFPGSVSVLTAVAMLVDTTRVSLALGDESPLSIDGRPATLPDGFLELPGGGRIEQATRGYEIFWSDGSMLSVEVRKRHLNAFLRPAPSRRGTLSGLFGDFNGNAADDIDASIVALGSGALSERYPGLAELAVSLLAGGDDGWALEQEESLFEYAPGQSTWTFRRPAPTRELTAATLPPSGRRRAEQACVAAGVTDPDLMKACVLDVGYTRDESFAETAMAVQERNVANWDAELTAPTDNGL